MPKPCTALVAPTPSTVCAVCETITLAPIATDHGPLCLGCLLSAPDAGVPVVVFPEVPRA